MAKLIDVIVNYEKLPNEIKAALEDYKMIHQRLFKAEMQQNKWVLEFEESKREATATFANLNKLIEAWKIVESRSTETEVKS